MIKLLSALLILQTLFGFSLGWADEHREAGNRAIEIKGNISVLEKDFLITNLQKAREQFELFFPEVPGKIQVIVGEQSSMRTGYSITDDVLHFPDIKDVFKYGIYSVDVINHEAFHLFVCRTFPQACPEEIGKSPEVVRLQEGLADFFAYTLHPDQCFGEKFYTNRRCIRIYDNQLLITLSDGPHAQGNALTRYLIESKVSLKDVSWFMKLSRITGFSIESLQTVSKSLNKSLNLDFSFDLQEVIPGRALSVLRKYWIDENQNLEIHFTPNKSLRKKHRDLTITWTSKEGGEPVHYRIVGNGLNFVITPNPNAQPEKVIAVIRDGFKVIGYRAYYFGVKPSNP